MDHVVQAAVVDLKASEASGIGRVDDGVDT